MEMVDELLSVAAPGFIFTSVKHKFVKIFKWIKFDCLSWNCTHSHDNQRKKEFHIFYFSCLQLRRTDDDDEFPCQIPACFIYEIFFCVTYTYLLLSSTQIRMQRSFIIILIPFVRILAVTKSCLSIHVSLSCIRHFEQRILSRKRLESCSALL